MNLLILEEADLTGPNIARLTDARAAHLVRVLKAVPGQTVRVGLLEGPLGTGTVTDVTDDAVTLQCVFDVPPPPRPPVDVLLALPRPKVLRRLWAQLAAIGVGQIVLTNAERVERDYFDTHVLDPGTYRPLLIEGLQQARDTRLPLVSVHRRFRVLVEDHLDGLFGGEHRLVAHPTATGRIRDAVSPGARALLAIGPEGGWNDFELRLLETHGFQAVGMGPRTLRTDTATLALIARIQEHVTGA